jgi:hypothetical protein
LVVEPFSLGRIIWLFDIFRFVAGNVGKTSHHSLGNGQVVATSSSSPGMTNMTEDPNNPVLLTEVPTQVEATAIKTALTGFDVEATTTGGYTSGFQAEAPGWVRVLVRDSDLDRAKVALAEIKKEMADFDWSQVDVGQPED